MIFRRIHVFTAIIYAVHLGAALEADESAIEVLEDPEDIVQLTTPAPPVLVYDNWTDWESWEPSEGIVKGFPRYRSGYDLDGLVIHVVEFGVLDQRKWASETKEKQEEFWKAYEWWTRREEKDAAFNNNQGIVFLLDFDGYTLTHYASSRALQSGLKMFSMLFRQNHAIKYGFVLNVNFAAESWLQYTKTLWANFWDKFEICGTQSEKWIPLLLRKMDASQLPPKYGGSKDWKPLGRNEFQLQLP